MSPPGSGAPNPPAAGGLGRPTIGPSASSRCSNGDLIPTALDLAAVDAATLCLVNAARHDAGVPALVENAQLDRAAAGHSAEMLGAGNFDHIGPDGRDAAARILATGYVPTGRGGVIGENIGAATLAAATPAAMVALWMRSPSHRANILNPTFSETGLGVAAAPAVLGNHPGATYTEEFA